MKKKILSIAIAAVLVLTAIFFAVYDAIGHTYDYAKKDMSKFLNFSLQDFLDADGKSAADYYSDYIAGEKEALSYIAGLLSDTSKLSIKTIGEIGKFDTVAYLYYVTMTLEDGSVVVISNGSKMDGTVANNKLTMVQMNADDDLADLFTSLLIGKKVEDYSYNIIKPVTSDKDAENPIYAGDIVYFDYTKVDAEGVTSKGTMMHHDKADLDAIYGEGFAEALYAMSNGAADKKIEIKAADGSIAATYTIKINYVTRTTINGGELKANDVAYFTFKLSSDKDTSVFWAQSGVDNADLDTKFGAGFADKLFASEIGKSTIITIPASGEGEGAVAEKKWEVKVEYAYREDLTGTDEKYIDRAEGEYLVVDRTYDDDAEDVSDIKGPDGKPYELKGKTVTYHILPRAFYDAKYDMDAIIETFKYTSVEDVKDTTLAKYLDAYAKYEDAKDAVESAETTLTSAENALAANKDESKTEELQKKVDDAKKKLETANSDLNKASVAYVEFNKPAEDEDEADKDAKSADNSEENTEEKEDEVVRTALDDYLEAYAQYHILKDKFDIASDLHKEASSDVDDAKEALAAAEKALADNTDETKTEELQKAVDDAQAALKTAEDKLPALLEARNKAEVDYQEKEAPMVAARKAYADEQVENAKTALADAEKALADNTDDVKSAYLQAKVDACKAALATAEAKAADPSSITPSSITIAAYDAYALEQAQESKDSEFRYDVAESIWDTILTLAKDKITEYPSQALRVAYEALYDKQEEEYYENKEKSYSKYSSFKAYLNGELGSDWKAQLEEDAKEVVLANIVLYRMVELTGVELTDDDTALFNIYVAYLGYPIEALEAATLFDKAMDHLTEELYPDLFEAEEDTESDDGQDQE